VTEPPNELVLDTGPLSNLAKAGWLGVLRAVAGDSTVVVPDVVESELRNGVQAYPFLQSVLDAEWILRRRLESPAEIAAYARFAARMVVGGRNIGETGVLAYASVHGVTAVIDDRVARKVAVEERVELRGTLGLLCEGIRSGLLTVALVSELADHLLENEYHLPFKSGGFEEWAAKNDMA